MYPFIPLPTGTTFTRKFGFIFWPSQGPWYPRIPQDCFQLGSFNFVLLSFSANQKPAHLWLSCYWLQHDLDQVGKAFTKIRWWHFERIPNILLLWLQVRSQRVCQKYNCRPWRTGDYINWTSAEYLLQSMGKIVHVQRRRRWWERSVSQDK